MRLLQLEGFWLTIILCVPSVSAAHSLCVLRSSDAGVYLLVEEGVEQALSQANEIATLSEILDQQAGVSEACLNAELVVTAGSMSAQYLLQHHPDIHFISAFVTKNSVDIWRQNYPQAEIKGAIYLDQPGHRLITLSKLVAGENSRVATLVGDVAKALLPELQQSAKNIGLTLQAGQFDPSENPVRQLEKVMEGSDLYLVLPDSAEINRNTAKWIIYLSYKYRIPVIGFSQKYAEAGALVSIYSIPKGIGRQAGRIVFDYFYGDMDSEGWFEYPDTYNIEINDNVRRALGMPTIDRESLHERLRAAER